MVREFWHRGRARHVRRGVAAPRQLHPRSGRFRVGIRDGCEPLVDQLEFRRHALGKRRLSWTGAGDGRGRTRGGRHRAGLLAQRIVGNRFDIDCQRAAAGRHRQGRRQHRLPLRRYGRRVDGARGHRHIHCADGPEQHDVDRGFRHQRPVRRAADIRRRAAVGNTHRGDLRYDDHNRSCRHCDLATAGRRRVGRGRRCHDACGQRSESGGCPRDGCGYLRCRGDPGSFGSRPVDRGVARCGNGIGGLQGSLLQSQRTPGRAGSVDRAFVAVREFVQQGGAVDCRCTECTGDRMVRRAVRVGAARCRRGVECGHRGRGSRQAQFSGRQPGGGQRLG